MIKHLLRTKDRRLIAIYILTSLLIYGAFWFSYYLMKGSQSLFIAAGLAAVGLLLLLIRIASKKVQEDNEDEIQNDKIQNDKIDELHNEYNEYKYSQPIDSIKKPKFPFIPIVSIAFINIGIGFTISAFFLITKIEPSRFFGLVLLIMLGYKIVQLLLGEFFNKVHKTKWFGTLYILCLFLEIIGAVIVLVYAWRAGPVLWQIFYALVLCVLYSFGQLYLRKQKKKSFWDAAAMAYLMGFIFIFVITLLIVSEGDFDLSGLADIGSIKDKKKRKLKELNIDIKTDETIFK